MNHRVISTMLCALSLACTTAFAANDMGFGENAQQENPLSQQQSTSMQDCQDASARLVSHGFCGQGDLACVARLEEELKNSVEKACVRAIDELKPKVP
ncbi:hypothetical protein [Ralstonia pseudosolanacearum]|uniref:hypothetical protein n=1 Tax=Ralstonia pseudosolanacearum TaxID=1310165 RepID=UPI003C2E4431